MLVATESLTKDAEKDFEERIKDIEDYMDELVERLNKAVLDIGDRLDAIEATISSIQSAND